MRPAEADEMRILPLFSGIKQQNLENVLQASFLQRFPSHVELVREGEPADFLHVVIDGQVEIFSAYRDRETTIAVVGPGACFIAAAVILDRVYLKSARTLCSSRILMIPAETVRKVFGEDSAFASHIACEMALSYRSVVKELKNQKLRTSLERLANWLIFQDKISGSTRTFAIPFDKKILAAHLGMAPEVLSRSFTSLVPYGVVVKGPIVTLTDLKSLTVLAKPEPTIDNPDV